MFNNSGSKLKVIAKVLFILLVLGSIAFGIVNFTGDNPKVLVGILCIVGGFFLAWFICLCITALGEAAMAANERDEADTVLSRRLNSLDHKIDLILDEQAALAAQKDKPKEKEKAKEKEPEQTKEKKK